ncbi:acireductone synthase [Corallococcus terminator]|uniref:Enolase-phosphatase E1 n=1 Tax=Corallococcus terminator TaxID=2316733 RepID=A0A3A8IR43_9BACT|nr:acireductone synthase [Corallococcus terminator]RKG85867.1 acireductone synthase [Corallococcus terminator]
MSGPVAIVTDVEGTTSSVAFVRDVLFPFARKHLAEYVALHGQQSTVRQCLSDARTLAGEPGLDDVGTVALLQRWLREDRKATPLKTLQGLIWAEGYSRGELKGHVYADAARELRAWHGRGLRLYVYSSGSVAAQKLLFGYSIEGDLTPLLSGHFDTTTGPKLEAASYTKIAQALALSPGDILFLSDSVAELDAARQAGLRTACLDRGEVAVPQGHGHPTFPDFTSLDSFVCVS